MASRDRILLVEDDLAIQALVRKILESEGFEVVTTTEGSSGLSEAVRRPPTLILLDQNLPRMSGLEVCRELRRHSATQNIPIIFLTGKGGPVDVAVGLGIGADDYIAKPFNFQELVARIRAVIRRTSAEPSLSRRTVVTAGPLTLDSDRLEGQANGLTFSFSVAEFKILFTLAAKPGVIFSRDQILDHMNQGAVVVSDRTVDVHINSIRKKLASLGVCVETVRGAGYRFRSV